MCSFAATTDAFEFAQFYISYPSFSPLLFLSPFIWIPLTMSRLVPVLVVQSHGTTNLRWMGASAPFQTEVCRKQPDCKVQ